MSCVPDNFYEQVYNIVSQVPSGTVITYKSIAVLMGYPQHARLVGRALKLVPKNLNIPCHRVVNCQGRLIFFYFPIFELIFFYLFLSIFSTLQGLLHPQQAEVGALRFRTILNILCIT